MRHSLVKMRASGPRIMPCEGDLGALGFQRKGESSFASGPILGRASNGSEIRHFDHRTQPGDDLGRQRLNKAWTKAEPGTLPSTLGVVATMDQRMNNGAAIEAAECAGSPSQLTAVQIDAGHGAQLSHPKQIADAILKWVKHLKRSNPAH